MIIDGNVLVFVLLQQRNMHTLQINEYYIKGTYPSITWYKEGTNDVEPVWSSG